MRSSAVVFQLIASELGVAAQGAEAGTSSDLPATSETHSNETGEICGGGEAPGLVRGEKLVAAGKFAEGQAAFTAELASLDAANLLSRACLMNGMGFAELRQRRPAAA